MTDVIEEKRRNSVTRIDELERRLAAISELKELKGLAIFVAGSYARQEASIHSDIDLFFILDGPIEEIDMFRTRKFRAFSKIIEEVDKLEFPAFSNDGEYLEFLERPKIKLELGGRNDDHRNYFTARMLMLLEGHPVYDKDMYEHIVRDIISAYFRDYTHHPRDFRPVFLINDIIRFWKTLCLNYEHKRNQPEEDIDRKLKQKIKNFKLKFSRMLTCYSGVISICDLSNEAEPDDIVEMTQKSPFQRVNEVVERRGGLDAEFAVVREEYEWFLEQTNVAGDDLLEAFRSKPFREEAFLRAERFGGAIFEITHSVASETGYLRYLLV